MLLWLYQKDDSRSKHWPRQEVRCLQGTIEQLAFDMFTGETPASWVW